jgi:hypothetical protein
MKNKKNKSELFDEYMRIYHELMAEFVAFYPIHVTFTRSQNVFGTRNLRRKLKKIRMLAKSLEGAAQRRRHEFLEEFLIRKEKRLNAKNKDNINEQDNSVDQGNS